MRNRIGHPKNLSKESFKVNKSGNDVKLFAKYNNKWYSTSLDKEFKLVNQHVSPRVNGIVAYNKKNEGIINSSITVDSTSDPILKLWYDNTNYATLTTAATGDLTIATVGSGTTDSDLILDVDGDILMDAAGGDVAITSTDIKIDAAKKLYLDGGTDTYITESSADNLRFVVGGVTMLDFTESAIGSDAINVNNSALTIDAAQKIYFDGSPAGHTHISEGASDRLDFTVGGDLMFRLDESTDTITMGASNWVANIAGGSIVEFSAANSAYAGMILGYTRLQGDLTNQTTFEIQNAMTVEDDTHQITFKTPPSEKVEIEATFVIDVRSTDTRLDVGLSTDNATDGYAAVAQQFEYDGLVGISFNDDELDDYSYCVKWVLEAAQLEAVGVSNTFWIGFSTGGATKTAYLAYGLRASHGLCDHPFIIKATALPATIYDGQ